MQCYTHKIMQVRSVSFNNNIYKYVQVYLSPIVLFNRWWLLNSAIYLLDDCGYPQNPFTRVPLPTMALIFIAA